MSESPPDHRCHRCKREFNHTHDHVKLELDHYLGGDGFAKRDYYLLCRFCYSDVVSWLYSDDNSMGDYHDVEDWNVPEHQKETY